MQHILGCQVMLLARAIKSLIVHATPTAHPVCAVCTGLVLPAICTHYYPSSRNSRTRTTCSRSSRITTCSRTSRTMSLSTPHLLVMPLVREPACMPPLVENLCRVLSIFVFQRCAKPLPILQLWFVAGLRPSELEHYCFG